MKVKKYLSVWAMVCAGALTLAGCSDYDNGYNENAIKFQEAFKETFGDIDPEQDWNLAERATVTVNTQTESNIKIYALRGDEFSIVGNYEGVKGTQMLGVDIIEGTRALMVTDGRTAQKCAPGDVVVFNSMNTRTTHVTTDPNAFVKVSKLTAEKTYLPGDDKTWYPKIRQNTAEEAAKVVGNNGAVAQSKVNLGNVTNNFSYVSTGPFIVYPYYWYTKSKNTVGIYYYDTNGDLITVPVYTIKENNEGEEPELYYEKEIYVDDGVFGTYNGSPRRNPTQEGQPWSDGYVWPDDWSVNNNVTKNNFHYNVWSGEGAATGIEQPYIEYWFGSNTMTPGKLSRKITGLTPNTEYRVEVQTRLWQEKGTNEYPSGVFFFVEREGNKVAIDKDKEEDGVLYKKTKTTYKKGNDTHTIVYGTSSLKGKSNSNGELEVGFIVNEDTKATWLAFKNLTVFKRKPSTKWDSTNGLESFGTITRGQGILVDIPAGTQFGMYLYSEIGGDPNNTITYYSQAELNVEKDEDGNEVLPGKYGYGWKYKGSDDLTVKDNWERDYEKKPSHASTFTVDGQMFFGFEDWSEPTGSDMDLNDVVLAVSGLTPTVINEDPETATWMLACEDLGGTFDRDYNDVVFKVDHISGQTFAKVTPLAAGGTLASYIFHVPETGSEQCLGEIHQLFGFAPEVSGDYEAHNAGASRGQEGTTVTITVPENWSMAYYSTNTYGSGTESYHNMGGFEIRTLPKGTPAPQTTDWASITELSSGASRIPAPDMGAAPYIICFPYSYVEMNKPSAGWKTETFWAWPQEFMTIDGCYPDFPGWVSDHSDRTYGKWYENRRDGAPTVSELKIETPMGNSPVLLPSQLGHDQETIYVVKNSSGYYDVNNYADLYANLTGADVSGGALHYYYYMHTWGETEANKKPLNADDHLANEDPRTIVVMQDADGTYEAGKTSFILKVSAAKTDPDFGTQTSIIQGGNWTNSSTGSGDRTINMTAGEDLWIGGILNGTTGTYVGTLKSFSTGGTNSTCSQWELKPGEYRVYTDPNVGGTMKVVLHYDGNDQYNAKDITITINTTKTVKLVNNGLALSDVKGALQFKTVTDDNQWTNFQKWRIIVAPNDQEFFYLYNVGSGRYLTFATKDDDNNGVKNGDVSWVSDPPTSSQGGKFRFDNGRLITKAKAIDGNKNWITDDNNKRFLGSTNAWVDGTVIWYASYPANAITWTENTLSSAKKR